MTYNSHWQFLKANKVHFENGGIHIFTIWKAVENNHCRIGKITMKKSSGFVD